MPEELSSDAFGGGDEAARPDPERRRPQRRGHALVRAVQPEPLRTEVSVPESSHRIDGLIQLERASAAWGPIRRDLDRRLVVLELFSSPPGIAELASTVFKLGAMFVRWAGATPRAARAPIALVVSVGRPTAALRALGLRGRELPGLFGCRLGRLRLLLVDVRGLPWRADTAFLKTFDHRPEVAARNLASLYADPAIDSGTKLAIGEAIMAEPQVWDPAEHQLTARELLARGRVEGRVEGARALLRRLLRERPEVFSPRVETALEACDDLTRLDGAAVLFLRGGEATALEAGLLALLEGDATH